MRARGDGNRSGRPRRRASIGSTPRFVPPRQSDEDVDEGIDLPDLTRAVADPAAGTSARVPIEMSEEAGARTPPPPRRATGASIASAATQRRRGGGGDPPPEPGDPPSTIERGQQRPPPGQQQKGQPQKQQEGGRQRQRPGQQSQETILVRSMPVRVSTFQAGSSATARPRRRLSHSPSSEITARLRRGDEPDDAEGGDREGARADSDDGGESKSSGSLKSAGAESVASYTVPVKDGPPERLRPRGPPRRRATVDALVPPHSQPYVRKGSGGSNGGDDRSVKSGYNSIKFGRRSSEDDDGMSSDDGSGPSTDSSGPGGMEVMDLRPSNHSMVQRMDASSLCSLGSHLTLDRVIAGGLFPVAAAPSESSPAPNPGAAADAARDLGDLPGHWEAAGRLRASSGANASSTTSVATKDGNPLSESEAAYRALMRLMSSEDANVASDDRTAPGEGGDRRTGGGRRKRGGCDDGRGALALRRGSFCSVDSLGMWSALGTLTGNRGDGDEEGSRGSGGSRRSAGSGSVASDFSDESETSPLTRKRRERRKIVMRRCARATCAVAALAAVSGGAMYLALEGGAAVPASSGALAQLAAWMGGGGRSEPSAKNRHDRTRDRRLRRDARAERTEMVARRRATVEEGGHYYQDQTGYNQDERGYENDRYGHYQDQRGYVHEGQPAMHVPEGQGWMEQRAEYPQELPRGPLPQGFFGQQEHPYLRGSAQGPYAPPGQYAEPVPPPQGMMPQQYGWRTEERGFALP